MVWQSTAQLVHQCKLDHAIDEKSILLLLQKSISDLALVSVKRVLSYSIYRSIKFYIMGTIV